MSEKYTNSPLFQTQLQWLQKSYVFREEAEIQEILAKYPFLLQLLIDAYSRIEAIFPNSQIFLEVAIHPEAVDNNPEMIDGNEELVVSICTNLSSREAIEALKKFYHIWWLQASKEAKGKISIGLECL